MNDLEARCFKVLEYGLELFKYHADQRLRCIRYFTAIVAAFVVGAVVGVDQIIEKQNNISSSPIMIIILLGFIFASAVVTLFFWLLDIRNRVLTEYAEDSLKKTEHILFGENNKDKIKKWNIVNNCENDTTAWHYGKILPLFLELLFPLYLLYQFVLLAFTAVLFALFIGFTLFQFYLHYHSCCFVGAGLKTNSTRGKKIDNPK